MEKSRESAPLKEEALDEVAGGSGCETPEPWTCGKCGQAGNTGNYCAKCGVPFALHDMKRSAELR